MHVHVGDPGEEMMNKMKYFACGFLFLIFLIFFLKILFIYLRERDHRGRRRSRFLAEQGA